MESRLSLKMSDLRSIIGYYLGYGEGSEAGDAAWTDYHLRRIDRTLESGLRRFYIPIQATGEHYSWSFLSPYAKMTLGSGEHVLVLPDDFGGFSSDIIISAASSSVFHSVKITGDVRSLYAADATSTGTLRVAALEPIKGTGPETGQRFQLRFYPIADKQYTVQFRYNVMADALTPDRPYPYGGMAHAETIKAACLAAAEQDVNDSSLVHSEQFDRRLAASIAYDRNLRPQSLGYNGDNSSMMDAISNHWRLRDSGSVVTFNGVQY